MDINLTQCRGEGAVQLVFPKINFRGLRFLKLLLSLFIINYFILTNANWMILEH